MKQTSVPDRELNSTLIGTLSLFPKIYKNLEKNQTPVSKSKKRTGHDADR